LSEVNEKIIEQRIESDAFFAKDSYYKQIVDIIAKDLKIS